MRSQIAIFTKRVRDHMRAPPPTVPAGTSVREAVALMAATDSSSLAVVDESGHLVGIVTEQDVTRRIAFQADPAVPVEAFATRKLQVVSGGDYLYRAVARMRRQGLRHMPVVDTGRPIGIIDLHEAVAVATEQTMRQIDRLTQEDTPAGMAEVKQAQIFLASELLADNLPAPEIQGLITAINRDIHRRLLERAIAHLAAAGWGDPPVPFALLIMGSGGRGENFLAPDQDNGFILLDYPDEDHPRIDTYFVALAERMTGDLDAVGFPLCKGNVMATNPLWRKSASQWRQQVTLWAQRRSPVAILFADIFFDFQSGWGPAELALTLRQHVIETVRAYPVLLAMMCESHTDHGTALGLFGRLRTARGGPHKGRIDLKLHGSMPLVASVRLLSLRAGIGETSTLGRIKALAEEGTLDANRADELSAAFTHVTFLLLRQQLADYRDGHPVGNYVNPQRLIRREREQLVSALAVIERLRKETRAEMTGRVL